MNIFKSSEVLKIAIQIEKNGLAFYSEVKARTKFFPVQEVFDFLAKEEVRHQQAFEKLLEGTGDNEPAESYPERIGLPIHFKEGPYPGEYDMYLKAIAGENVFTRADAMRQLAAKAASDKAAIDAGIGFEKDSIIFFGELMKFVPAVEQGVVAKVIAEERSHLLKLLNLKQKL